MKNASELPYIDVDELRIGMLVHLDGSWTSHPFARSSFRIVDADQISTLRNLGLKKIRWSPEASTAGESAREPSEPIATHPNPPANLPEEMDAQRRRDQLDEEREAWSACERRFLELSRTCADLIDLVPKEPVAAGKRAQDLVSRLLTAMPGSPDLCIRLIPDDDGDDGASHAINVTVLSLLLAKSLAWQAPDLQDLGLGALLHDVGKLELPVNVRIRSQCSQPEELRLYEQHAELGFAVGMKMGLSDSALHVIREHHELADGSGFPAAMTNDNISWPARIVELTNHYDNLCNSALAPMSPHDAMTHMFSLCESKFDSIVMGTFLRLMGIYPAGTVVQLTDDRIAMVVAANPSPSTRRRVLIFDQSVPRDEALFVDLTRSGNLGIRRAVKVTDLAPTVVEYLRPRRRLAYHCRPASEGAPPQMGQAG